MTPNQEKVLCALVAHGNISDAAEAAGVSRSTVERYMQDEAFSDELKARQGQVLQAVCASLRGRMGEAVAVLSSIMNDTGAATSARIQAARSVLEYGIKVAELHDLTARVEALEKEMNA